MFRPLPERTEATNRRSARSFAKFRLCIVSGGPQHGRQGTHLQCATMRQVQDEGERCLIKIGVESGFSGF